LDSHVKFHFRASAAALTIGLKSMIAHATTKPIALAKQLPVGLTAFAVIQFDEPAEGSQRVAPSEFRLFHTGTNHTDKGDFLFDEVAAQSVMDNWRAKGVPLMGDFEHQSLVKPPIIAPASIAEFTPEVRRDANGMPELWAVNVIWTDDARALVEQRKYRFYSPAFIPDEAGRVRYLINVGLTNLPASFDLAPLVAASTNHDGGTPMDLEKLLAMLGDEEAKKFVRGLCAEKEELSSKCTQLAATNQENEERLKKLTGGKSFDDWAKEEEAEHDELKQLRALSSKLLETTGATDAPAALTAVALAVAQGKELVALKSRQADEKVKTLAAEFDALVEDAVKRMVLPPAGPVSKEFFVSLRAEFGVERALAALRKAVPSDATPIVQLTAPKEPNPSAAVSGVQLSIAANCGGRFGGEAAFKSMREAEEKARAGAPSA
jgi:phage I-like protein